MTCSETSVSASTGRPVDRRTRQDALEGDAAAFGDLLDRDEAVVSPHDDVAGHGGEASLTVRLDHLVDGGAPSTQELEEGKTFARIGIVGVIQTCPLPRTRIHQVSQPN